MATLNGENLHDAMNAAAVEIYSLATTETWEEAPPQVQQHYERTVEILAERGVTFP